MMILILRNAGVAERPALMVVMNIGLAPPPPCRKQHRFLEQYQASQWWQMSVFLVVFVGGVMLRDDGDRFGV